MGAVDTLAKTAAAKPAPFPQSTDALRPRGARPAVIFPSPKLTEVLSRGTVAAVSSQEWLEEDILRYVQEGMERDHLKKMAAVKQHFSPRCTDPCKGNQGDA